MNVYMHIYIIFKKCSSKKYILIGTQEKCKEKHTFFENNCDAAFISPLYQQLFFIIEYKFKK